ncbi:MAG: FAD:protein FMN transferase [Lachnospiraceae bacterium]|nr:FAD:protein FMN transferase [Lachnospiraceae bacterium]
MSRKLLLSLLGVAAVVLVVGCVYQYRQKGSNTVYQTQILAMDTVMSFTAYGRNAEAAVEAAVEEVERLDALLSTGSATSEVSCINANGGGTLSEDTQAILEEALTIYEETGGLFDVTVYPLVELWGFYSGEYHVPTEEELKEALAYVDASAIRLDGDQVWLGEGQRIDLGGIAKGYTSARIMEIYEEYGVTSGMVSLGGNVQTLGTKPDGSDWRIGIQDPDGETGSILGALPVVDKAVITSGGYERYFEEDGNTYIHILDPRSGCPADSGLISVSIVSENGMLADALSTALYLMGLDEATEYWRAHADEFDAIFVTEDREVYVTEGIGGAFEMDGKVTILEK